MQPTDIAVLAVPGMSLFHLSVPSVVFKDIGAHYRLVHVAESPGTLATSSGIDIVVDKGIDFLDQVGVIIVPTWHDPFKPPTSNLINALRNAHDKGTLIVGLCLGAYVLAAAGLLDGRRATTHWAFAKDFSKRFPAVDLDPAVLYVDGADIMTSAGTAAAIDCCLHLVRKREGSREANRIARRLVMPPHRDGGQAQFIETAIPTTKRDYRLSETLEWILANLNQPHSIESVASRTFMSRRTFTREFMHATGETFTRWLIQQRLRLAQQLLETTACSIDQVAEQTGFGSTVTFRQHFSREIGLSPQAWRKRFAPVQEGGGK